MRSSKPLGWWAFGVVALVGLGAAEACVPLPGGAVAGAAMEPGERMYRTRCGSCHELFPPFAYDDAQWPAVLARMQPESRLSDEELQEVLRWLRSAN